ncbi:uncharacterized protein [Dysidea avara]|uniref:uncharacterized protein n=1 Tax=Dysidea avara TaxID=196820 RepID=UPI00331CE058
MRDPIQENEDGVAGDRKFIVFESQLLSLFQRCHSCGLEVVLKTSTVGIMLVVEGMRPDGHVLHWQSQPTVNRTPAGNLLLAATILLCGLTFTSIANLADVLNLAMFCEKRYYDFQNKYMYPVVHTTYTRQQEAIVEYLRGSQLHLSGDGCCDSPGYSAKYCTYTLMDSATDLILDYSLLQCTDTTSSVAMEKEGLRQCLDKLMVQYVNISTIATDRHTGVKSLMKTDYLHIDLQYDVWHLPKSVTKKLGKKAKTKHCGQVFPWIQPISNLHL